MTDPDLWGVYLLRCADGSFYCGVAKDVQKRVAAHNHADCGARYTRSRRPVELLLFTGAVFSRGQALRLENKIKALPRPDKLAALLRTCTV